MATEKYDAKIPGVFIRVFITSSARYPGHFAASILYADKGLFNAAHTLEDRKTTALSWAEAWLAKRYGGKPKLSRLP